MLVLLVQLLALMHKPDLEPFCAASDAGLSALYRFDEFPDIGKDYCGELNAGALHAWHMQKIEPSILLLLPGVNHLTGFTGNPQWGDPSRPIPDPNLNDTVLPSLKVLKLSEQDSHQCSPLTHARPVRRRLVPDVRLSQLVPGQLPSVACCRTTPRSRSLS